MRTSIIIFGLVALAACGQREPSTADEPMHLPPAVEDAFLAGAGATTLEDYCRQAVKMIHGQDSEAVAYAAGAEDATLSWMADSGQEAIVTCRVENGSLTLSGEGQTHTAPLTSLAPPATQGEAR